MGQVENKIQFYGWNFGKEEIIKRNDGSLTTCKLANSVECQLKKTRINKSIRYYPKVEVSVNR